MAENNQVFRMLTPTIRSLSDLVNKLDRELWRAFHHRHLSHKADHFYNFCVTALAVKDHFFEAKGITESAKKEPYRQLWNGIPELVAVTEVANSAKHFLLREPKLPRALRTPKTKSVSPSTSGIVHVFSNADGDYKLEHEPDAPDYSIELSDGRKQGLYEFMDATSKYWQTFLAGEGISLVRQSTAELHGTET